jgi:hypothetical protein
VSVATSVEDAELHHWTESLPRLREMLTCGAVLVGHNVAYDLAVVCAQFPVLTPFCYAALLQDRVTDTMLRQRLLDIEQGCLGGYFVPLKKPTKTGKTTRFVRLSYSLSVLHKRHGFGELEKDEWRLKYGELRDVPLERWPDGAVEYAALDAVATLRVYEAQEAIGSATLVDQYAQTRAAFALHMMSVRGYVTDPVACAALIDACEAMIDRARQMCVAAGLVRESGTKNVKAARERLLSALHVTAAEVDPAQADRFHVQAFDDGRRIQLTPGGAVAINAQAARDSGDSALLAYATLTSASTLRAKALLMAEGSRGLPLQTRFETLLETGRTSSSKASHPLVGPASQNFARDTGELPGMRECIIPRAGLVFCSIDGDNAESRAAAQAAMWMVGYSRLAEALNAGRDVHMVVAAQILGISYDEAITRKKDEDVSDARQLAKVANFSLFGGARPSTMLPFARGMGVTLTLDRAEEISVAFHEAWPEIGECLQMIRRELRGEPGSMRMSYAAWVSGRVRGDCRYTQAANGLLLQSLIADAFKAALLPLEIACHDATSPLYGSAPLLFLHDEVLLEVPVDTAHEAAYCARDIIVAACAPYLPDVPMTAEPALMMAFTKGAPTLHDSNGRLTWR